MNTMIERATRSVQEPEVQDMLRQLVAYGLGVCIPHQHNPDTGEFEALPPGVVQFEEGLEVTFKAKSELPETALPVAWVWDDGLQIVAGCAYCGISWWSGKHVLQRHGEGGEG